jgi:hypothetical protein
MSPSASSPTTRLGKRKLEEVSTVDEPPKSSSSSLGLQVKVRNNNMAKVKVKRKRPAHSPFASLFLMALEKRPALRMLLGNMRKTLVQPVDHHASTCIENANSAKGNESTSQSQPIHTNTSTSTNTSTNFCTTEKDLTQEQKDNLLLDRLEETLVTSVTIGSETTSECHSMADEEEDDDDDKHYLEEEEEEQNKHSLETETEMETGDSDYDVPNAAIKTALHTAKCDTEILKTELEEAIKSSLDYEWKYSDQVEELQDTKWQNKCLQKQLEASKRLSQLEAVLEINMKETWDYVTVQQQEIMVARQQKDHLQQQLETCQKACLDWDWKYTDQQEELKLLQQEKTFLQRQLKETQQKQQRHDQEPSKSHRGVILELQQQPWRVVPSPSPRFSNHNYKSDDSEIKKQLEAATKQCLDLDWRFTDQQEELSSTKQALEEARRQLAEQRATARP